MDASDQELVSLNTLDEIIAELEHPCDDWLPIVAIRAAQLRSQEITPRLIELIRAATEENRAGKVHEGYGPFFAVYLLAEFQAKEALPAVLDAMLLPDGGVHDVFGDGFVDEDLGRILAVLGVDAPETIDGLIANRDLDESVRSQAAAASFYWVRDGRLARADAVERLRGHLRQVCLDDDFEFATPLILELLGYVPTEAREEIKEAYQRHLVETFFVDEADVEACIAEGDARFQRNLAQLGPTEITDTAAELSWWDDHAARVDYDDGAGLDSDEDGGDEWDTELPSVERIQPIDEIVGWESTTIRNTAPRVGRNEPCPCGSGKKYKKCCGGR